MLQHERALDQRQRHALAAERFQEGDERECAGEHGRLAQLLGQLERGAGVLERVRHVARRVQAPPETLEDLDAESHVVDRLGQGREEDVGARAESLLVRAYPAEADEGARPSLAVRRLADDLLEQRPRMADLAGLEVPLGRFDAASPPSVVVPGRREAASLLQQIGGGIGRAARRGAAGGLLQRHRDRLVRLLRSQGEMPGALLGIVEDLGEPPVQRAPLRGGEQLIGDRREQRVREREPLAVLLQHAGSHRRGRPGRRCACKGCVDDPQRRPRQRRGHLRGGAGLRGQELEPIADELLEVGGDGQLLGRLEPFAAGDQCPADLEREEEVAAGCAAHALQRAP